MAANASLAAGPTLYMLFSSAGLWLIMSTVGSFRLRRSSVAHGVGNNLTYDGRSIVPCHVIGTHIENAESAASSSLVRYDFSVAFPHFQKDLFVFGP